MHTLASTDAYDIIKKSNIKGRNMKITNKVKTLAAGGLGVVAMGLQAAPTFAAGKVRCPDGSNVNNLTDCKGIKENNLKSVYAGGYIRNSLQYDRCSRPFDEQRTWKCLYIYNRYGDYTDYRNNPLYIGL